ncbi:MAG TPA: ribosome recycling factor [Patescibacteria group bacterium]
MLSDITSRTQKAIEHLKSELSQIRTGRATPALIENVTVDVYGGSQRLTIQELGQISAPDPHMLTIAPWDKSIVSEISNGIIKANLNLNPVVDTDLIRISIPPLTEERRKELIKQMQIKLEAHKVEIRQVRQDQLKDMKAKKDSGEISEDEFERQEKELQKEIDKVIEEIEVLGEKKEKELLEV